MLYKGSLGPVFSTVADIAREQREQLPVSRSYEAWMGVDGGKVPGTTTLGGLSHYENRRFWLKVPLFMMGPPLLQVPIQ